MNGQSGAGAGLPFSFDGDGSPPGDPAAGLTEASQWEAGQRLQGTRESLGGPTRASREAAKLSTAGTFDAGEFRLVTRLATGASAEVWLAEAQGVAQADFPSRVVVKRLLPALRIDPASVERFRAEALLGAALVHENLARTFGLFQRGLELFLVQELLGGETIGLLSAAARKKSERLAAPASLHAIDRLLSALTFLHGPATPGTSLRLVHGNISPDALVARYDGSVKLIDLGLSQTLRPDGTVHPPDGALRGSPAYLSPEQVKARPLDPRSDLFSASVLLWELLANRPLFAAETAYETLTRVRVMPAPPLRSVWHEAPTSLERILVRALSKEPATRFQTAADLAQELRVAARREGLPVGPAALAAETARLAPRGPRADG